MLQDKLYAALKFRQGLFNELDPLAEHHAAVRLFNGFTEGQPGFAADLYGKTLVIFDYAQDPAQNLSVINIASEFYLATLSWLSCIILKRRSDQKDSLLLSGNAPDTWVQEYGIHFALDLTLHQDATLFLDTRLLRRWILENTAGKSVLNTFAYTGSLGAAARGGGARHVIQTDLDRTFLRFARKTYQLNHWQPNPGDFLAGNFFTIVAGLKRQDRLFDCIILDPPFFSDTPKGRVDLNYEYSRLVNKVRPLVAHDGWLVAVNNAIYVSGEKFMATLADLCADGYLRLESLIPAPDDFTGSPETSAGNLPSNPAPFNHSTKIAVLRARRKDGSPSN